MVEGQVNKPTIIEDGAHNGIIIELNERTKPYNYLDLTIEMADKNRIKVGYPKNIMLESKLGELLIRFGANLVEGTTIKLDPILIGKECGFVTIRDGKFAKVLPDSVKPKIAIVEEVIMGQGMGKTAIVEEAIKTENPFNK